MHDHTMTVAALLEVIDDVAQESGVVPYLVGGFVRDELLGREGKDIDMVVVGSDGVPLLTAVARRLGWPRPQTFEHFGTGQIRGDGFIVEVVRARSEQYDPSSRKPSVEPGTLEEDIWRRDFTVNALCRTIGGEVIDITGRGLEDLRTGVLRTPLDPHETFREDPLRMFRAARFAAQLGFAPADGMIDVMREQAPRSQILSVERIAEELRRLLVATHPRRGLEVLRDGELLDAVMPELAAMVGVEQGGYHVFDVFDHTTRAVESTAPDLLTRLGALFHDVGKPPTHAVDDGKHTFYGHPTVGAEIARAVLERFRFSNEEISATATLVNLHLRPIQYDDATFSDAAVRRLIRDAGDLRDRMLDIARADTAASSYPNCDNIDALEGRMARLDVGGRISALRSPLDGNQLMQLAPDRGPGPWVGAAQRALTDAVLNGEISPGDDRSARAWLAAHPELLQP